MMHYSLVLNFLVKKQTWKEDGKSEEKQTQTTKEIKKKKWFGFLFYFIITYNWVWVILSSFRFA